MAEFDVSLDLVTRELSVSELSRVTRVKGAASSHNRGDRRLKGVWDETVLRVESGLKSTMPLDKHLKSLFAKMESSRLRGNPGLPKDLRLYLSIGVFFSTPMCSIKIPSRYLKRLAEKRIELEVSSYPHPDENQSRRSARSRRRRASGG